jgi:hypothetical protein
MAPRLAAILHNYASSFHMVVPRPKVESRVKSMEERLQQVEDDVRAGRSVQWATTLLTHAAGLH